jgi:effector-binding domain-containing protein
MIDDPQITQTTKLLTAVIHLTIPKDQIRELMGPGVKEVMAVAAAQGIGPTGPWYTHHFKILPDQWDFEIGVPVSAPVVPTGRVEPGQWPAMRVARTVYHGGYEGLTVAWPELDGWIEQHGHKPSGELWECYLAGPESGGDPAKWRTQLDRPLI